MSRTYFFRILALITLCIATVGAKADGINAGDITITDHLSKGYISVAFGFYDDYHNDEYLRFSEDSYIKINGEKALVMSATNSDQKPQREGSSYWVQTTAKNGIYSEYEDGTPIETNTRKSYNKIGSLYGPCENISYDRDAPDREYFSRGSPGCCCAQ